MAYNPASYYGRDTLCVSDANNTFDDVSGLPCLTQDLIHLITTDSFLDDSTFDGTALGWDARQLLGKDDQQLASYQPILVEALQRDDRVQSATVALTATKISGIDSVQIVATGTTALGPFSFTVPDLSALTSAGL